MSTRFAVVAIAVFAAAATACQVKKSANPLSPSVAGPIPGVSITTPALTTPAPGARVPSDNQPITLTLNNATTSGVRPLSYLFEVASDAAFTTLVASQADIKPDQSGRTSFTLPATLPDKTYFWRARAQDGANTGAFSTPASFIVYTPVVLQTPAGVGPASGGTLTTLTPKITFTNALRSGPVGTVRYAVAVFNDPFSPSSLHWGAWSVTENPGGQTSVDVPPGTLAPDKVYHWTVQATDGTTTSAWSTVYNFRTPAAPAGGGAGGTGGAGGGGGATGAGGGGGVASDFSGLGNVTIVGGSPDVSTWPATSRITSLRFSPGNIHLEHTKLGQWPGVDIGGALQESTLWVFFNIGGRWYATGAERWRPRQTDKALSAPSAIGPGWFYNGSWAPMTNYVPRPGEQVGFMVVAGSTRADARAPVRERSTILMIPFPRDGVTASFP